MANVILKSLPAVVVSSSGTKVQASSTAIDRVVAVFISAPAANTGAIQVGDSTTKYNGTAANRIGVEVQKGTSLPIQYGDHYIDLQQIYVDAANSGDIALISYLQVV